MLIVRTPWVTPALLAQTEACRAETYRLITVAGLATPDLLAYLASVRVRFSARMVRTAGTANLRTHCVTLNARLLAHDATALQTTFVHEVAHLLAYQLHQHHGHGRPWQMVMLRLGYEPQRCHRMDVSAIRASNSPVRSKKTGRFRRKSPLSAAARARLLIMETTRRLQQSLRQP